MLCLFCWEFLKKNFMKTCFYIFGVLLCHFQLELIAPKFWTNLTFAPKWLKQQNLCSSYITTSRANLEKCVFWGDWWGNWIPFKWLCFHCFEEIFRWELSQTFPQPPPTMNLIERFFRVAKYFCRLQNCNYKIAFTKMHLNSLFSWTEF